MDYEATAAKSRHQHSLSFGKRFRVHTDIANCFPSIYSHSVPWAVAGFAAAKASKLDKNAWFNQLDEKLRWCKRNETNGLAIGPATSNVIVEAVLSKVDEAMAMKHFVFVRYIDDYTAYCDTEGQAQDFIHCLGVELDKYKLLLNIKKTSIDVLPEPITPAWVSHLSLATPKKPLLTTYDVANYLSFAQSLAKQEPDGSVIKYAVKVLLRAKMRPNAREFFLGELLVLAYHYPIVVPLLRKLLRLVSSKSMTFFLEDYDQKLNFLLEHHAFHHRSDAMCWLLFFIGKLNFAVSDAACKRIIETRDCLALLLMFKVGSPPQKNLVKDFTRKLNSKDSTSWTHIGCCSMSSVKTVSSKMLMARASRRLFYLRRKQSRFTTNHASFSKRTDLNRGASSLARLQRITFLAPETEKITHFSRAECRQNIVNAACSLTPSSTSC